MPFELFQVPLPMTNQVVEKGTSAEMPTIPTLQVEETKPNDQGSLTQSPPELSGQPLKIPALPQAFLELTFDPDLCIVRVRFYTKIQNLMLIL